MNIEVGERNIELLPPRMNAMWYSMFAAWLTFINPLYHLNVGPAAIFGIPALWIVAVNSWNNYKGQIMDERKQGTVTNSMAWSFMIVILALTAQSTFGFESESLDFIELGFWTWILIMSTTSLYQIYGR